MGIINMEANSFRISYQIVKTPKVNFHREINLPSICLEACLLFSYDFKKKSFSC